MTLPPDDADSVATLDSPDLASTIQSGRIAVAALKPLTPARSPDLVATAAPARAATLPPATGELPSGSLPPPDASGRITVLPRVEVAAGAPQLVSPRQPRYAPVKLLGQGGMGEVSLEHDQDIGRQVAIKRLLPQVAGPAGVARFVDEVRTVGQLEHPNIVPVHDVGVDDQGRYFFVMKHLEGETLESIVRKLQAGDPAYVSKYSPEYRVEIFLGILRALDFAHGRGYLHRDVKPANVMVGRHGEVVLMDWGIAKPIGRAAASAAFGTPAESADLAWAGVAGPSGNAAPHAAGSGARLSATRHGALVGTPAYMSPEQARGLDSLDQRSDLYSATVLFHEFLTLRHYLAGAKTLEELVHGIVEAKRPALAAPGAIDVGRTPTEYLHFCERGLQRDPAARFQSASEMIERLQHTIEGKIHVQCPATFTKRMVRESGRFIDRAPYIGPTLVAGGVGLVAAAAVQLVRSLL